MSELIRFDVIWGPPVDFGALPPAVTIVGYPPHEGEGSRDYMSRVQVEIMREAFAPKPSLFERLGEWLKG
jgi:hypothetical protein